jgi:hypothetical protein
MISIGRGMATVMTSSAVEQKEKRRMRMGMRIKG